MKVSAIITTMNRAGLLKKAIESVLNQTHKDFELIVLDNNSKDETEKVVRNFTDSRIIYIRHKQIGISEARNLGVKNAHGEYVGFLDDDDEWLPNKLELQVALFERSSSRIGLVYGGFERINPDGIVYSIFTPRLRGDVFWGYFCDRDPLTGSASNPLMRKEVFTVVGGYDEKIKTSEDWEFYLRLARKYEFDFVPKSVVRIRQHAGPRLGDRLEDAAYTEIVACEEFGDILKDRPRCHSNYLQTIGGKYCRVGKSKIGRKYLREAISKDPLNVVAYVQYTFSFLGKKLYQKLHKAYKLFR